MSSYRNWPRHTGIPWRAAGKEITDCTTTAEAIRMAGLDFNVEKRPLFTCDLENFTADPNTDLIIPEIQLPDHFAVVRTDTDNPLGVVKKRYRCVQNMEVFNALDTLVGAGHARFDAAGIVDGGKHVYMSLKLPDHIRVGKDDLAEQFLFISTAHDGSKSLTVAYTPVRVFCTNMLHAENALHIIHTSNATKTLAQAGEILQITGAQSATFAETFNHWSKVRITDPEVLKLIQIAMAPNQEVLNWVARGEENALSTVFKNTCSAVYEYAMTDPTQTTETTRGTLYGAYNAITGYFQNVRTYRDDEAKLKSMLYGGVAQQRTGDAFSICERFAAHGKDALLLN